VVPSNEASWNRYGTDAARVAALVVAVAEPLPGLQGVGRQRHHRQPAVDAQRSSCAEQDPHVLAEPVVKQPDDSLHSA